MKALNVSTGMKLIVLIVFHFLAGCNQADQQYDPQQVAMWQSPRDSFITKHVIADTSKKDTVIQAAMPVRKPDWDTSVINTRATTPSELVAFAQKQLGIPYRYGSIDPRRGFDCSGFITYVFSNFRIKVPRSSISFTNVGKRMDISEAKVGDLILFTGTDSSIRRVGHMGIIYSTDSTGIQFIHSSSGKAYGVTITPLNKYYKGRFMSVRRIFPQNER
jgi:cell wall-associated NlpC family hydrolase